MVRWASGAIMLLCIIHLAVLGLDVPGEWNRWISFNLWTFDHWQFLRAQPIDLALSGAVFWATVGSFAFPLLILGALVWWLDRRGLPIPSFVGWSLAGWMLFATLLMAPSGFPVGLAVALVLAAGLGARKTA